MTHSDFKYLLFLAILVQIPSAKCLACYACMAINYRQNVLSRNDELLPPQSRENLSLVIDSLIEHDFGLVAVSSSCADVALTSQPSFLNSPISICAPDDRCAKMDFVFKGEKIVLRNCLSSLLESPTSNIKFVCPKANVVEEHM
ncbi:unnamed protein product [Caenorhabditis bovis]|uniref:DUF19 domain-containing protein n=1 Tax=Caenorhabditis bovis TaxID=2654633 RepID=A0A8S1EKE9_9PELO|nr:unnamed protein product [Caenorhabditis bovis]